MHQRPLQRTRRSKLITAAALLAGAGGPLVAPPEASALVRSWVVTSGNWSTPANWSGGVVPGNNDDAAILGSVFVSPRTVDYDYTGPPVTLEFLRISGSSNLAVGPNVLTQSANSLSARTQQIGISGRGAYNQTGGSNVSNGTLGGTGLYLGLNAGGIGAYNLGGGHLSVSSGVGAVVGSSGAGVVNHSGGSANFSGMTVGENFNSSGAYNLSAGGLLTVENTRLAIVGLRGTGVVNQTGGSANITKLELGFEPDGRGSYSLSGGRLNVANAAQFNSANLYVGVRGQGTFTHSGGTLTVQTPRAGSPGLQLGINAGSTGTYLLSGTGVLESPDVAVEVGNDGTGHFIQTGGTHTSTSVLVGARGGTGRYAISDNALLNARTALLVQNGTMTHSGGVVNVGKRPDLLGPEVFGQFSMSGAYALSAGSLNVHGLGVVAGSQAQPGMFEQTGGVHDVSGVFFVGFGAAPGTTGTYLLSGGRLKVDPIVVNFSGIVDDSLDGLRLESGGTIVGGASDGVFSGKLTQDGGTIAGTFRNEGTIVHKAGNVTGTLLNRGTLTASNGTLLASNTITNEVGALVNGTGTISGTVVNHGQISPTGALAIAGVTNTSSGVINLNAGASLRPALLDNANRIRLAGGALLGNGTVTNPTGAVISGGGTIQTQLVQGGGTVRADNPDVPLTITSAIVTNNPASQLVVAPNAVMNLQAPFNNGAIVSLQGTGAALNGPSIINTGTIRGAGQVANIVTNNGVVRPEGGALVFTGGISNAGTIALGGGELDAAGNTFVNTGTILGRGTLRAGALSNAGTMTFTGAVSDVFAPVTNAGRVNVTGSGVANFFHNVNTTAGTINVNTNSTAVFFGPVTGINRLTGGGVKDFEAGASGGAIATVVGTTLVGPQGALTVSSVRDATLDVVGRATVAPNGTPAGTSRVNVLDIDGAPGDWTGTLDLNDNDLVVDYTATSPLPDVRSQLRSGFAGGAWNGRGITSTSAAQSSNPRAALGYAEASSLNLTSFHGEPLDATALVVTYTASGDANLDGLVSLQDFNRLAANFGQSNRSWVQGDFNYDATVNLQDFNLLAANFGQIAAGAGVTPHDWASLAAAVPEPGGAVMLLTSASSVVMSGRFRRRRKCVGL